MPIFLLRRLLYILILLWIISIISFWLSRQVPGDVVMDYISIDERGYHAGVSPLAEREVYERVAVNRGLDLPLFYFSIAPVYMDDRIPVIIHQTEREHVTAWAHTSRNGSLAYETYLQLQSGLNEHCSAAEIKPEDRILCINYNQALHTSTVRELKALTQSMLESLQKNPSVSTASVSRLHGIDQQADELNDPVSKGKLLSWMPSLTWHGGNNQYHRWMSGLLLQKPLVSLVDGRNAWVKIYDALKWTLLLNGISLFVALILGIAIGIWSGKYDGASREKVVNWILFALFALPSFWLGTLLIYFFASGEWLMVFPAGGLGDYQNADNIWQRIGIIGLHLILPVACMTLGALAYVSRQMKQSIMHESAQPYAAALRLHGVKERTILHKHVVRNALFPIITIAGGSIPALLSGSLIIEVIFSIPGMGRLMYTSLLARDWPVAFPILMLGAAVTILAYLLTDLIYKWADPRVKTTSR